MSLQHTRPIRDMDEAKETGQPAPRAQMMQRRADSQRKQRHGHPPIPEDFYMEKFYDGDDVPVKLVPSGPFKDDGTINLGMCGECRTVGPIGYRCRTYVRCADTYKVIVGANRNKKVHWIDGKLFEPLTVMTGETEDPDTSTEGLAKIYERNEPGWWEWCQPVKWDDKKRNNIATRIYNGEFTTTRDIFWALEREDRSSHLEQDYGDTVFAQGIQFALAKLYFMDRQELGEKEAEGEKTQRRGKRKQSKGVTRPETRSQDRKKRAKQK